MKRLGAFILLLLPIAAQAAVTDGYVVKVEKQTVFVDWGKESGVKVGDQFSIYRKGTLKHPVTGKDLGPYDQSVATGVLDKIEPQFSEGRLLQKEEGVQVGDRTRIADAPAVVPPATPAPVVPAPAATTPAPATSTPASAVPSLQELWRSDTFKDSAVGIVLADIDGDGSKEVVVAFQKFIEAFRLKDGKLVSMGQYKERRWGSWIALDAADLKKDGREEIFATAYMDVVHRGHIVALRWENDFKRVGDLEGFARSFDHSDGTRVLLWQSMTRAREAYFQSPCPIEVTPGPKGYKAGSPLGVKRLREDQLFGFVWGDWDGDKAEDLALLQNDHLRVFFTDAKWSSSELYGGTKADFSFNEQLTASVAPRLVNLPQPSGASLLVAPHNIAELGIRLERLKIYKKSEIEALKWNGLDMLKVWSVQLAGYLADYAVASPTASDPKQLLTALIGPGGKTVIVSYAIP